MSRTVVDLNPRSANSLRAKANSSARRAEVAVADWFFRGALIGEFSGMSAADGNHVAGRVRRAGGTEGAVSAAEMTGHGGKRWKYRGRDGG
jgi:hypothetical protein